MERVPVTINGLTGEVAAGTKLAAAARAIGVPLRHDCGKKGYCLTCRVRVLAGAEHLSPMGNHERAGIGKLLESDPALRLACQCAVQGAVEVERVLPPKRPRRG